MMFTTHFVRWNSDSQTIFWFNKLFFEYARIFKFFTMFQMRATSGCSGSRLKHSRGGRLQRLSCLRSADYEFRFTSGSVLKWTCVWTFSADIPRVHCFLFALIGDRARITSFLLYWSKLHHNVSILIYSNIEKAVSSFIFCKYLAHHPWQIYIYAYFLIHFVQLYWNSCNRITNRLISKQKMINYCEQSQQKY